LTVLGTGGRKATFRRLTGTSLAHRAGRLLRPFVVAGVLCGLFLIAWLFLDQQSARAATTLPTGTTPMTGTANAAAGTILAAAAPAAPATVPVVQQLTAQVAPAVGQVAPAVGQVAPVVAPVVQQVATAVAPVVAPVVPVVQQLTAQVAPAVGQVAQTVAPVVPVVQQAPPATVPVVQQLTAPVAPVAQQLTAPAAPATVPVVQQLTTPVVPVVRQVAQARHEALNGPPIAGHRVERLTEEPHDCVIGTGADSPASRSPRSPSCIAVTKARKPISTALPPPAPQPTSPH